MFVPLSANTVAKSVPEQESTSLLNILHGLTVVAVCLIIATAKKCHLNRSIADKY